MAKFLPNESSETKPPQFYKDSLLNWFTIVSVVNVVIGDFNGKNLK